MKKRKFLEMILVGLLVCMFTGCHGNIKYGGKDVLGNTGADAVRIDYENRDWKQVRLEELAHCKVVDQSYLRESDEEWIETISDKYAYCFVQTADTIFCEEDCEEGSKGDTIPRYYYYALVMESKDSEWEIVDFGYPPFYVIEKK